MSSLMGRRATSTLGVEAVLADGRVLAGLSKLRKDNTGYDLTRLMIGSEGTLGVITAATVKLFPQPRARIVAFVGLANPGEALDLLNSCKSRQQPAFCRPSNCCRALASNSCLRTTIARAIPFPCPSLVRPHRIRRDGGEGVSSAVIDLLSRATARLHPVDVAVADSIAQAAGLWRLRELMSEAQKHEGGSIKHDVSVAPGDVPAFIAEANRLVTARIPGSRPVPFGHMGDGNIHYNVSRPVGADATVFLARWDEIGDIVHGVVEKFGGSISAEHGIGLLKRDLLRRVKDPTALEMMRAIKHALDPKGILNPGKLL